MEDLTVVIPGAKLREYVEKNFEAVLTDRYGNPLKKCIEDAISGQGGAISKIVSEIIAESIGTPEFRAKMSDIVIQKMVEAAIRR